MKKYTFKIFFKSDKTEAGDKQIVMSMTCKTNPIPYEKLLPLILKEVSESKNAIAWECKDLK